MTKELKEMKAIVMLNDDETWSSIEDTHIHMMPMETFNEVSNPLVKWNMYESFDKDHFTWSVSASELLDFYLCNKGWEHTPLKTDNT